MLFDESEVVLRSWCAALLLRICMRKIKGDVLQLVDKEVTGSDVLLRIKGE